MFIFWFQTLPIWGYLSLWQTEISYGEWSKKPTKSSSQKAKHLVTFWIQTWLFWGVVVSKKLYHKMWNSQTMWIITAQQSDSHSHIEIGPNHANFSMVNTSAELLVIQLVVVAIKNLSTSWLHHLVQMYSGTGKSQPPFAAAVHFSPPAVPTARVPLLPAIRILHGSGFSLHIRTWTELQLFLLKQFF